MTDPARIFTALDRMVNTVCPLPLVTVTAIDQGARLARRCYSSMPQAYPVTGVKPLVDGDWSRQVLQEGQVFVANDTAGFAPYFSDHALINSLGCEAAANIPILDHTGSGVVCTVNLLGTAGVFTPAALAALCAVTDTLRDDLIAASRAAMAAMT